MSWTNVILPQERGDGSHIVEELAKRLPHAEALVRSAALRI
jgi:hypothetical protein